MGGRLNRPSTAVMVLFLGIIVVQFENGISAAIPRTIVATKSGLVNRTQSSTSRLGHARFDDMASTASSVANVSTRSRVSYILNLGELNTIGKPAFY